jgi:mitochondrial fission protein ELM1
MSTPTTSTRPPLVWLLADDKAGHRSQLRGLAKRLTELAGADCHWVEMAERPVSLWQCWRGANVAPELPAPDLVVSAGSAVQRALLASRRYFGCFGIALSKPNFPYRWLDAAIVPQHDAPPASPHILATRGVLNVVEPSTHSEADRRGLILIGGLSKHFGWDSPALVEQVAALCREAPDWHWTLTDSRRTPPDFLPALAALALPNLTVISHADTPLSWLPAQLAGCSRVWVTPDSVSMVYEAITSGAPTGLFTLPAASRGRIVGGLQQLIDEGLATPFERRAELGCNAPRPPLWEADRAARWLLQRLFPAVPLLPAAPMKESVR